jgi:hypothetical protein
MYFFLSKCFFLIFFLLMVIFSAEMIIFNYLFRNFAQLFTESDNICLTLINRVLTI